MLILYKHSGPRSVSDGGGDRCVVNLNLMVCSLFYLSFNYLLLLSGMYHKGWGHCLQFCPCLEFRFSQYLWKWISPNRQAAILIEVYLPKLASCLIDWSLFAQTGRLPYWLKFICPNWQAALLTEVYLPKLASCLIDWSLFAQTGKLPYCALLHKLARKINFEETTREATAYNDLKQSDILWK